MSFVTQQKQQFNRSRLNRSRRFFVNVFFLLFFTIGVGFVVVPLSVGATGGTIQSYSGCFERENDNNNIVVWIENPVECTITIENSSTSTETLNFIVKNIDSIYYQAQDATGNPIEVTRYEASMTFSKNVESNSSETITLTRWDYDETTVDFWFAAISDPQPYSDSGDPNPVYVAIMDQLELLGIPFVTNSGDLITGDETDTDEHEAGYILHDEVRDEYEGSVFSVPGDHDAENDLDAYYSAYYGSRNYTYVYGNTRFVGFSTVEEYVVHDTTTEGLISQESFDWLESVLSSATEEHIVVYMHHPLVPPSWSNSGGIQESQRLQFGSLLTQYGVELLIVGDAHGYDYSVIDDDDIPGLSGSVVQLDAAGAGGKFSNYDGDHFFMLVHVTEDGIEKYRMDYSDFDYSVVYDGENDGTESVVTFVAYNQGKSDIPYARARINMYASEKMYASDSDGNFYDVYSQELDDGIRRAFIELNLAAGETKDFTVQEHTAIRTGVTNMVESDGLVVFNTLPTPESQATELSVPSTDSLLTIDIVDWDTALDSRSWTVSAEKGSVSTFQVSGLNPARQYTVYAGKKFIDRVIPDSGGLASFTHTDEKKTTITYRLELSDSILPTKFGVLPSSAGGPHFLLYGEDSQLEASFFTYDKSLKHGFQSLWADLDNDGELELVTVPNAEVTSHIRVFESNGEYVTDIYPFGRDFALGVSLAVGDTNGDGMQELIVAPQGGRRSTVQVYEYRPTKRQLVKVSEFEAYSTDYTNGVNIVSADVDGDGDDEIAVGALQEKKAVRVFTYRSKQSVWQFWFGKKPFTSDDETKGFSLSSGDVDFDGIDEVVVGSYTGGGMVKVLKYQKGKRRLRVQSQRRAFEKGFVGGVNIIIGNIDGNKKEEILVSQRADDSLRLTEDTEIIGRSGLIKTFRARKKRMREIGELRPFGVEQTVGVNIALVDIDNDWKLEIISALDRSNGDVAVFEKEGNGVERIDSYSVYDENFDGGLELTQSIR